MSRAHTLARYIQDAFAREGYLAGGLIRQEVAELERLAAESERLREALERGAREGESDSIRAWCYLALHSKVPA